MNSFVISSAHSAKISGAVGIISEVTESRRVVSRVAEYLRQLDATVTTFNDDVSTTVSANISAIVSFHNRQSRDLDISVHFNEFKTTDNPMGTEVLYRNQNERGIAAKVSDAIAQAGGFIDRGAKQRLDLGFLNGVNKPAILIEVCFVDSVRDVELYRANFDKICLAIAETISGKNLIGDEDKMTQERFNQMLKDAIKVYNTVEEVPQWAKTTVKKMVDKGYLQGSGKGLNLTEDMIRLLVILDRAENF
jgi:N-acetylmuramoyl-L-alanine amidase